MNKDGQAGLVLLLVSLPILAALVCDVAVDVWWSGRKWMAIAIAVLFVVATVALFLAI